MADIELPCPSCGKARTVSEFSDRSKLTCKHCGAPFATDASGEPVPPPPATDAGKPALKLAKRQTSSNRGTPSGEGGTVVTFEQDLPDEPEEPTSGPAGPGLKKEKRPVSHAWFAWGFFLLLGGVMYGLRYEGWLPNRYLNYSLAYGWIVVVGFHIAITLRAMVDNILLGILCLLVPGYSLYYLFVVADTFFVRALFAGLLIGIGQDAAVKLNEHMLFITSFVHAWIAKGGGDIR